VLSRKCYGAAYWVPELVGSDFRPAIEHAWRLNLEEWSRRRLATLYDDLHAAVHRYSGDPCPEGTGGL